MKPSILFVDDEPNVLSGLKRTLYPKRNEWIMAFCDGGRQALAELESTDYDILITDLLMPDMDGASLLEEVFTRHPSVIRLVLSGHSDKKMILKVSRYAHQFLAKPLQSELLARTINRMIALRDVITNPAVQQLAASLDRLPALPAVHQRILSELQAPQPSMLRLGELITQDMGLSATMLKLVNSSFFGLRSTVSSPAYAVNLLGLDVIAGLVLSAGLFNSFDAAKFPGYHLDGLWQHSLNTGLVCKALAKAEGLDTARQDDLYIAGILHDIGKLVLLTSAPQVYAQTIAVCQKDNTAIWRTENAILGCTHAELGAYLLSLWGFSEAVIPWVNAHHMVRAYPGEEPLLAGIVHASNALEHEINVRHPGYDRQRWNLDAMERMGLSPRLADWRAVAEGVLGQESAP
ncbi:HDOD domain-containing protein [Desulfovibrio aerotolerans]|uniref:HDOD domain-containing protein n=1 Tax=Solidesulfovibrio aerotolerans TaxID=295255 RepID=A0A7C9ITM4_9BACT|nr:response regulator [Solidesulfovibrio aerotolerans]MYL84747.1 HDOD domain-containing protein [Solidesulfovibrio aerotolerans]